MDGYFAAIRSAESGGNDAAENPLDNGDALGWRKVAVHAITAATAGAQIAPSKPNRCPRS